MREAARMSVCGDNHRRKCTALIGENVGIVYAIAKMKIYLAA